MNLLAVYLHHLDPYIFKLGPVGPRYYGVAYLLGFLGAYILIKKLNRDGMLRLHPDRVPDMVLNACIFGVLVGGRLGFVLFYDLPINLGRGQTPLLWDFSSSFPFWGALRVWDGGMAAHGGIVFTILTLMIFAWRQLGNPKRGQIAALIAGMFASGAAGWALGYVVSHDQNVEVAIAMVFGIAWLVFYGWKRSIPVINMGDAGCMVVPIGLFFGRLANFINGELYGHPTDVPWAVRFPSEIYAPTNGQMAVSDESMMAMKSGISQYIFDHADKLTLPQVQSFVDHHEKFHGSLTQLLGNLNLEASATQLNQVRQALASYVRDNPDNISSWDLGTWWQGTQNGLTEVMATWFNKILPARHPSQLYEALFEGLLLFILCWTIGRLWRKDGMASGAFLTFYPIMRIIGEQFRVGDTPAVIFGHEISKGVLYSLPMFVGGAIYWAYFIARSKPRPWKGFPIEPDKPKPEPPAAPAPKL